MGSYDNFLKPGSQNGSETAAPESMSLLVMQNLGPIDLLNQELWR